MFAQKTAIVTGATRGIGKAIANALAANGAQTILIGRDPQRVKATEQLFQKTYGEGHRGVVLDITNKEDVAEAVKVNPVLCLCSYTVTRYAAIQQRT